MKMKFLMCLCCGGGYLASREDEPNGVGACCNWGSGPVTPLPVEFDTVELDPRLGVFVPAQSAPALLNNATQGI
jgi:hypothetical protein